MTSEEQQNIDIKGLQKDISYMKDGIATITKQVSNEMPHQIEALAKQVIAMNNRFLEYQLKNQKWLVGILVSLVFVLVGMVISFLK